MTRRHSFYGQEDADHVASTKGASVVVVGGPQIVSEWIPGMRECCTFRHAVSVFATDS